MVDIEVVNSLCDNFEVLYRRRRGSLCLLNIIYTLSSDQITIPQGQISAGVEVQLTDAFFADPKAIETTYVIPLVMSNVHNADSILSGSFSGKSCSLQQVRLNVLPKDYILYAVKYINPWDTDLFASWGRSNYSRWCYLTSSSSLQVLLKVMKFDELTTRSLKDANLL